MSAQLTRAFGQDVKESLFKPAPLLALPILIICGAQLDDVFGRNVGRAAGRREHLALHHVLDLARDLDEKLFPHAPRPRLLVNNRERVFFHLAVNPFAD